MEKETEGNPPPLHSKGRQTSGDELSEVERGCGCGSAGGHMQGFEPQNHKIKQ